MYYYSDEERINKFDYDENFGVEYASQTFMNEVVKHPNKISVPVGAGAYAASKSSGGITNISAGDFYDKGVIYFERNPHFLMGQPKINKVRYQVVSSSQMLNTLYNGEVDIVTPNAKPETIEELSKKNGISSTNITTAGYGYIGINASKVPDMKVRQAIMHSINTQECVDYYKAYATPIHRGMSSASWAYPEGATAYYPYIGAEIPEDLSKVNPAYRDYVASLGKQSKDKFTEEEQRNFIKQLVEDAGYTIDANGIYTKGDHSLKYTFTIAGELTDHPAWQAMFHAGEILNEIGFQVNVTTDANALKKLSTGALTVWAAAWGSTIDPDMYQVFHKDSNATSVLNWGYKQIIQNVGGKYDLELVLVEELSELIEQGRQTIDQEERKAIYSKALDIVMELAIELPTYQRKDLFAYNTNKIDASSLTPEDQLSPYKGLTRDLHNVSLRVK
jgi:peptide/nickel transport system substrate-binding protein